MGAGLFFDLSKHPEIRFESSKVVNTGDKLMVTGTLSMLGVTREVTVPVRILGRGTHPETGEAIAGFEAEMKVKLSDLGVDAWTQATGILGDSLNIRLRMVGVDQVPQAQVVRKYPEKL
ncbi:MAG: YceI family protein [bacterium]|nr:YceI family protein [bacterium]